MGLFSKDLTFYNLLDQQAATAHKAAQAFFTLASDFGRRVEHAKAIDEIEAEGDTLTHELANRIDATFVTPLDKEDLRALAGGLDDITDFIDACAARIAIYEIPKPRPDLPALAQNLVDITAATVDAVAHLRNVKEREHIQPTLIRIHELENLSDDGFRNALATLFNAPGADPIEVMKWKEVYDRIERAVDKCEEVANLVESVVVKYA